MSSIRHFVILLSAAIILLIGCSALAQVLTFAQTARTP